MNEKTVSEGRKRILDAAEALFMEHGYRAVSIRDIAQVCDVTNAALYYHFPNKAALFSEVMERYAQRFQAQLWDVIDTADNAREQASAVLKKFATMIAVQEAPLFAVRREFKELDDPNAVDEAKRIYHSVLEPLEDVLRGAIERGELEAIPEGYSPASLLFGMMHGSTMHYKFRGHKEVSPQQVEEVVDLVIQVFWDGLKTPENIRIQKG